MNFYNEIKEELINNEINKRVKEYQINRNNLDTYYNVGRLIVEAQGGKKRAKYGDGLIKEFSTRLTKDLGHGYSERSLKEMRRFYLFIEKGHALHTQLSWNHYKKLFPLEDDKEIDYYMDISIRLNLGYRELGERIKTGEYKRLPKNINQKFIKIDESYKINSQLKNPIIVRGKIESERITEKILKKLILENITSFMKDLGEGYLFGDTEYKIRIGDRYNYIDLLLFNYIYNCFVVVELKVTELKKEHIGQIQVYMNYIDKEVKKDYHNNTIGIILCRKDNKFIMEYCSDERILSTTYKIINI